jgi:hypothetical protein
MKQGVHQRTFVDYQIGNAISTAFDPAAQSDGTGTDDDHIQVFHGVVLVLSKGFYLEGEI